MAVNVSTKLGLIAVIGAVICVSGGIMYALLPILIEIQVKNNLRLLEGSEVFELWKDPPVPIYMQFYVFNVTNSKDVENLGAKPIVQQLGPYTYREYRKKRNITWTKDKSLMSFYQDIYYVFLANMSAGSQDDKFTTVNVPIIAVTNKIKYEIAFVKVLTNNFLYKDGLFTTKSVGEFLFKGFKIDFIDKVQKLLKMDVLPNGRFGVLYGRNNTDDGKYTFHTGIDDVSLFGKISTWNESRFLPRWEDEYCNMINGTDGSLFPPFIDKETVLYGFAPNICRSLYATYQDERVVEGIKGYRFTTPFNGLAASAMNPDNRCFCVQENYYPCRYSGLIDVSRCSLGVPLILSGPHFYLSELELQQSVIGLNPNKFEHETYLDIEPTIGMPMNGAKRIQANIVLEPIENIKITENLPRMLFPLFWANESVRITPEFSERYKSRVQTPLFIVTTVIYITIATGALIVLGVILYTLICFRK